MDYGLSQFSAQRFWGDSERSQAEAERLRDLMARRHEPVPPFDLDEARMSMSRTFDLQMQLRAELDTFIPSSPN